MPKSPYAANKLAGEGLLRAYAASYTIDTVSLRYFNIFGPRQNANSAYAAVIAAFAGRCLPAASRSSMVTARSPAISPSSPMRFMPIFWPLETISH